MRSFTEKIPEQQSPCKKILMELAPYRIGPHIEQILMDRNRTPVNLYRIDPHRIKPYRIILIEQKLMRSLTEQISPCNRSLQTYRIGPHIEKILIDHIKALMRFQMEQIPIEEPPIKQIAIERGRMRSLIGQIPIERIPTEQIAIG